MKFTLDWLKDHLDTDATLQEICDVLDRVGLEVENVENPADKLSDFVIAKVEHAEQHPNADKLRVCTVNDGTAKHQVVCGAPNARTGLVGVFAGPGVYVPGIDMTLTKAKIRDVESFGMLCSERELELSDEHDGIIDLDEALAARIGERYVDVMGMNDPVLDIAITPNRPDALGVRGIARDLAAAGLGTMKPENKGFAGKATFDCPVEIKVEFDKDTLHACPAFAGRYIRGVTNGPSAPWMQKRLLAIGLRPINALVDITNYVSYDRGRPLHAYDADKLQGTIHARLGRDEEKFIALGGKEYDIDADMTVIADDSGVLALGGVMGGETTGSTADTTNVFFESAWFDPVRTANCGRKVGLNSDARYRFERGVDPQTEKLGADLAAHYVLEMCGGETSALGMAGEEPDPNLVIDFDPALIVKLTGLEVKAAETKRILTNLGFTIAGKGNALKVTVPSWRPDVHGSADLVEEVIRIVGIDTVPSVPMVRDMGVAKPVMTDLQKRVRRAKHLLAGRGLVEAVTYSFIQRDMATLFGGGSDALELANPISSDMSSMRPSLLPSLLQAAQRNVDHGLGDVALFEVGQVYAGEEPGDQTTSAAAVRMGGAGLTGSGRDWRSAESKVDAFDAKADAAGLLAGLGLDPSKVQISRNAPAWYHPGRSGTFQLGPKNMLGHFGEIHPSVAETLGLTRGVVAFELTLENLPARKKKSPNRGAVEMAELQPVKRDFAFVVDAGVAAGDLVRAAQGAEKKLITGVAVFDIFEGPSLGEGKKSLAIEVTLQPRGQSMTDEDIDAVANKVVAQVKKATGGEIRG